MPDFKFPGDAKSLPEFRLFSDALRSLDQNSEPTDPLFVFTTLKIILSYQAQVTSRPGFLSQQAQRLLEMDLKEAGVNHEAAMNALGGTVLEKVEGGWMDHQFASANADLSPKHRRPVDVGAQHSVIKRNRRNIEADAAHQQMLLPPETFKDRTGKPLDASEIRKVLMLIRTVDLCVKRQNRGNRDTTAGLIADATHAHRLLPEWVVADGEKRDKFFYWISDMKGDPRFYDSTELIFQNFEAVLEMYQAHQAQRK